MSKVLQQQLRSPLLAAEEYPIERFSEEHAFLSSEEWDISGLAHSEKVLLSGSRGSGKSALLIEALRRLAPHNPDSKAVGTYISLRNLDPLRMGRREYEKQLCKRVISEVQKSVDHLDIWFYAEPTLSSLRRELFELAMGLRRRQVLLFDDVEHIGYDPSFWVFVDILNKLSTPHVVSCSGVVYTGTSKFGARNEIYNYARMSFLHRAPENERFPDVFVEIINKRFAALLPDQAFGEHLNKRVVAWFLAKSVLGNMRAFILACHKLACMTQGAKIELCHLEATLLHLSRTYYWPLLEQLRPKLGLYEPVIEPALEIAQLVFTTCAQQDGERYATIRKDIVQNAVNAFALLEYAGLIEVSRMSHKMSRRAEGTLFRLNLCNLLDAMPEKKLTDDLFTLWMTYTKDSVEFPTRSPWYQLEFPELEDVTEQIPIPEPVEENPIPRAFAYGITE
ncbi:MAG: hypothetical protein ACPGWR_27905 [Ardenticatenaceae bacterium]